MNDMLEFIGSLRRAADDLLKRLSTGVSKTDTAVMVGQSFPPTVCDRCMPRDTAVVVDVSGSMGMRDYPPTRLAGGIHAGIEYADTRAKECPSDRIAVVSFSSEAHLILPLTPVTDSKTIRRTIRRLTADGGTDLAEGLRAAVHLFQNEPPSGRRRHVIVLTDGQGGKPLRMAVKLKERLGVAVDIVGIGGSPGAVNEVLLRRVATTDADGFCHYRFVKDTKTLSEHYAHLAKGLVWRGGGK